MQTNLISKVGYVLLPLLMFFGLFYFYDEVTREMENKIMSIDSVRISEPIAYDSTQQYTKQELFIIHYEKKKTINIINSAIFILFMFLVLTSLLISYYNYAIRDAVAEVLDTNRKFIVGTINDLRKSIVKYQCLGAMSLIITLLSMLIMAIFVGMLFQSTIDDVLKLGHDVPSLAILLVVLRTSLLGSLIVSFIIYAFKFTTACFDQAVRFNKRKQASLFLLEVLKDFGTISLSNEKAIMSAFREWNVSVDSAFTDSKSSSKLIKQLTDLLKLDSSKQE